MLVVSDREHKNRNLVLFKKKIMGFTIYIEIQSFQQNILQVAEVVVKKHEAERRSLKVLKEVWAISYLCPDL
jgi:hypothetical protein